MGRVPKGIYEVQLLTYMKLAGVKLAFLMNFNVTKLKGGIKPLSSDSFVLFVSFVVKRFCTSARVLALDPFSLVVHSKRQRAYKLVDSVIEKFDNCPIG